MKGFLWLLMLVVSLLVADFASAQCNVNRQVQSSSAAVSLDNIATQAAIARLLQQPQQAVATVQQPAAVAQARALPRVQAPASRTIVRETQVVEVPAAPQAFASASGASARASSGTCDSGSCGRSRGFARLLRPRASRSSSAAVVSRTTTVTRARARG